MKTLLILRHAKSSRDATGPDHDRPLNDRGRRDAPRMGRLLSAQDLVPDLIVSSTARRARKTAEAVAEEAGYVGAIDAAAALYLASPETITRTVRALPEESARALLVGHNPGMEDFVERVTGRHEHFPTAALACLELDIARWQDFDSHAGSRLVHLWRPKELPAETGSGEPVS
jgi:phosphohistidine phosphatase